MFTISGGDDSQAGPPKPGIGYSINLLGAIVSYKCKQFQDH